MKAPTLRFVGVALIGALMIACRVSKDEAPTPPALDVIEQKNPSPDDHPTVVQLPDPPTYPQKTDDYSFHGDWETLTEMPAPAGSSVIPAPWSPGANVKFSDDIRGDYKKSDGWEWYTSSFSYKYTFGYPFFILYNKYRGIFRNYYYLNGNVDQVKDFKLLAHTLTASGVSTPMLNFADQKIIDVTHYSLFASAIEPQPIEQQAWYAVEYEIAYDPQIASINYQDLSLMWKIANQKLLSLTLNNTSNTVMQGKIQVPGFDFSTFLPVKSADANIVFSGHDGRLITGSFLSVDDLNEINHVLNDPPSSNLTSEVIPDNPRVPYDIRWDISVDIARELSGVGIANVLLSPSGCDNSSTPGLMLVYNEVMGIFNLAARPVVQYREHDNSGTVVYEYSLQVPSVQYLFNPAVKKVADITDIRQEIVATAGAGFVENGSRVKIYSGQSLSANLPLVVQGVRVSFVVVPKDGSSPVTITKTFLADIAKN